MRYLLVIVFTLIYSSGFSLTISGRIENTRGELINLTYMGSSTVSSPNYYGDKRYSTDITDGEFYFNVSTSREPGVFILELPEKSIKLLVKENDSIYIKADLKNLTKTFLASGRGSSMTNYLLASAFLKNGNKNDIEPEKIIAFWKNLQLEEINFLKAFQSKSPVEIQGLTIEENQAVNRLKTNSRLTNIESNLLANRANYHIVQAIDRTPFEYLIKHLDKYLELFADIDFSKNFIINDYVTDNLVSYYVKLSCYKKTISQGVYNKEELLKCFWENIVSETISLLGDELEQKELSDIFYDGLLAGRPESYIANKKCINTTPYQEKLEIYYNNLMNGLSNSDFKLNAEACNLNDTTVTLLLDSLKGRNVYLILWDTDSSPSLMPTWELPVINLLKDKFAGEIYFLDICLADESQKRQWASLIVNHNWIGHHFFYNTKTSDELFRRFNCKNGLDGCSGEMYLFIDKSGKIINSSETVLTDLKI